MLDILASMILNHPGAAANGALRALKWSQESVKRTLTVQNDSTKNIYVAVCVWGQENSVEATMSTGWLRVEEDDYESFAIPMPRFGSAHVAIHGRTRKGKREWAGSGSEQAKFHVMFPRYGVILDPASRFCVLGAASNMPEVYMNQGGVQRTGVVSGRLIEMSGDFRYTFQ